MEILAVLRMRLLSLVFLTVFSVCLIQAQTFTGSGFTIVDGGSRVATSCSTVAVSGVVSNRTVTSISLINTTHTFVGDLEIRAYMPGSSPPAFPAAPASVVLASPPDLTPCNFLGTYRFIDTAVQSIDAATVGCADAANIPVGDYRTSTYGGGTDPGTTTSLATSFGILTPVQANGNWAVCVFDFATPDGGSVGGVNIVLAAISVSGRVTTADGRGLRNAAVVLTDSHGVARTVMTGAFGTYRFDDVPTGDTYVISVGSKEYHFTSRALQVTATVSDEDLVADP